MKKQVFAGLFVACGMAPAMAQSNVMIYGIVDAGLQMSDFGKGRQTNLSSGMAEGSRIGFKGSEDLGGGYRALFTLEARLELDNGSQSNGLLSSSINQNITQGISTAGSAFVKSRLPVTIINSAGALFDRQSYVGLSTPHGTFLLGRQYTPGIEIFALSDVFELGLSGTWLNLALGPSGVYTPGIALRANQALQYRLQMQNGMSVTAMYGLNSTGSLNLGKHFFGTSLRYKGHGLDAGVAYNQEQDQAGNKALTTITVGGTYVVGDVKIFAGLHHMKNDNSAFARALAPGLSTPGDAVALFSNLTLDGDMYTVGLQYTIGLGRIMAGINHVNDKRPTNGDATLAGLGYDYFFSKRTDLYALVAHVSNQRTAQYALGGAGYFGGSTSQRGQDAKSLQLGMRHRF